MSVTVRVALRVRPLNDKESREKSSNSIIAFTPSNPQQIRIDQDRRYFTFDYVYPPDSSQDNVYCSCIQPLFDQFIKGYNATILAYGQTGSGKTYSMGTTGSNDFTSESDNHGIIPRFAESLFSWIQQQKKTHDAYQVKVSFLELYNEDIIDLLNSKENNSTSSSIISIREDTSGCITWSGVYEEIVDKSADLLSCLYLGSLSRSTASTDMNSSSSRSHAIFTVTLTQEITTSFDNEESIHKKLNSKFHFVDLAGSERLKKTNAVGDRAKEGISINSGLLALGNVISALGDESKRNTQQHVPYRNSKLTRLLQDSLGGNSQTLMLACVSPADSNSNETLSTLKYANRAKNITNTIALNQEQSVTDTLKEEIMRLREELQLNDAFMKEVHIELEDLRAKNIQLSNGLQLPIETTDSNTSIMVALSQQQQQQQTKTSSFITTNNNTWQQAFAHKKKHKNNSMDDDDDEATLVNVSVSKTNSKQHLSTSTSNSKRRKKTSNSQKKSNSSIPTCMKSEPQTLESGSFLATTFSLDKHKNRMKKEALFIKQIKNNKSASSDPILFMKMFNLFQSSIKEQKQLVQAVETFTNNKESSHYEPPLLKSAATATAATSSTSSTIENNTISSSSVTIAPTKISATITHHSKKPSMIKQPTKFVTQQSSSASSNDLMIKLTAENQVLSKQLKQMTAIVKKAVGTINSSLTTNELKPALIKAIAVYNKNDSLVVSHSNSIVVAAAKSEITLKEKQRQQVSSLPQSTNKITINNINNIHKEIQRIVAIDNAKSFTTCLDFMRTLKQKKAKLVKEQKELLKERKQMLQEFYTDNLSEQHKSQQYMDERIDTITAQVDVLVEQIKILQLHNDQQKLPTNIDGLISEILRTLKEPDLRTLLTSVIEKDLVMCQVYVQLYRFAMNTLTSYQQGFIQLRRSSEVMDNQILMDLIKSPVRCLSSGLILFTPLKK